MKKISLFATIIILVFAVFLPAVFADGLGFSDIEVEVDGEVSDDVSAAGGSFEPAPGEDVEITVEVENTFSTSTTGHQIESISVELDVDAFCPNDLDEDIEEEISLDDLDPGIDDSAVFRFIIPECASEGDYDADIRVEGRDDDDGTEYVIEETLLINVEKNPEDVTLEFSQPEPETIDCEERTFAVSVEVHNIGSTDLDTGLLIINDDLGVNHFEFLDLRPGKWTNEETYFVETFTFTVDEDVPAGSYDLRAEVEYADNTKELKRYQSVIVPECEASAEEVIEEESAAEESSEEAETAEEETAPAEDEEAAEETDAEKTTAESSETESSEKKSAEEYFTLPVLLTAIVIALIILVGLVVALRKK